MFISALAALRGMVNLPVDSMKTGGVSWFTDLTMADPFYILPVCTAVTLLITLEVRPFLYVWHFFKSVCKSVCSLQTIQLFVWVTC